MSDEAQPSEEEPIHAELSSDYGEPTLGGERFSPVDEASENSLFEARPAQASPEIVFAPPVIRTPNIVDALLFLALLILGLVVTAAGLGIAIYAHLLQSWFGLKDFEAAANDTRIALGTQMLIYLVGLGGAVPLFRAAWHKNFFDGLHWQAPTAWRLRYRLVATAIFCNLLAMVGNAVLPFPKHAPIDKMFSTERDAWLLMSFGVLVAPFFEEMIFRGFLLPAMATAWDWCGEKLTQSAPRPLDSQEQPQWSMSAQVFAALFVSVPFALMHSAQVGSAWGPVSLLYCVSLVLCAVRLITRSLAASTMVHATYNLALFAVMMAETDGFRHLDKL